MVQAVLFGKHEYRTSQGQAVQIWMREGKYLARGRWQRGQIFRTLGSEEEAAHRALQRLLIELEDGKFQLASEARSRQLQTAAVPVLDLRELANRYLIDCRKLKGAKTTANYQSRLAHALDFIEQPKNQRKWPHARHLNRDFAIEFKEFLFERKVTPNGRIGATPRVMSPRMMRNCLEALRGLLAWAARADVRLLPADFVNPITPEIIGPKEAKDPLRQALVPQDVRIRMVECMNGWQLLHLSVLLVLPTRMEDVSGALISDIDWNRGRWKLGTRFHGNDFNKEGVQVEMPLPPEMLSIFRIAAGGRGDGPLFCSEMDWLGKKKDRACFTNRDAVEAMINSALTKASRRVVKTAQDRKGVVRRALRASGAVTVETLSKELRTLLAMAGCPQEVRAYDLRGSVTSDMQKSGMGHLALRYLTMHATSDILNEYTGVDPVHEMSKYFEFIQPLLQALVTRAQQLRLTNENSPILGAGAESGHALWQPEAKLPSL
jgi:hypothetical protein